MALTLARTRRAGQDMIHVGRGRLWLRWVGEDYVTVWWQGCAGGRWRSFRLEAGGERVALWADASVWLNRLGGRRAWISVEAPKEIAIVRGELVGATA